MKLLMYGAGSIGRGFIAPLFAASGYEIVFVDIDPVIVEAMNQRGCYQIAFACEAPYTQTVSPVRAVDGRDAQAVAAEITHCDILATALGANVLERVAPLLAQGLGKRMEQNKKPLDILICENLKDAPKHLAHWLRMQFSPDSPWEKHCGLIETAIGRMVPVAKCGAADPLFITVEEYGFLPVDAAAFRNPVPHVAGLIAHSPFAFYEERKLYLHNMGHCICAALGQYKGYELLADAVRDSDIALVLQSAMSEAAQMLSERYSVPFRTVFTHAEDLLLRFSNRSLGDSCERVARDPLRKLAADDRLAGAMCACETGGIHPVAICFGYAALLAQAAPEWKQAQLLMHMHSKLSPALCNTAEHFYTCFTQGQPLSACLEALRQVKRGQLGNNII